jgi:hypothetical protein
VGGGAWARTAVKIVTPQNISGSTFRLEGRRGPGSAVEFTVRRDVKGIDRPAETAYLYNPKIDGSEYARRVKLEQKGDVQTFRFSVPGEQVADTLFTIWGRGRTGEGPSYRFRLGEFWKTPKASGNQGRSDREVPRKGVASSSVAVEQTTLTFDPRTCTEGRGMFYWGLGSCSVKVLGRKGVQCVFEYTEEIEMGTTVSLVEVPVSSGPVTVKIDSVTMGGSTYPWPVTSFRLDRAKVIRSSGPAFALAGTAAAK